MVMNPNLPEEIILDIFSRLPTKSVGKFRCLSKPWRALLSSPNFIKFHLTRQTHQQNLLLVSDSGTLHFISTIKSDDGTVSRELDLSNTWSAAIGSCNGLVLLLNEVHELFLVNPITKEQVNISHSPSPLPKSYRIHGFGYDSANDDYKIVTLSCYHTYFENRRKCMDTMVDVYSMKKRVWKRVNSSAYDQAGPLFGSSAYVNGVIHWLSSSRESYRSVIVAFDFVNEVFYEIPTPLGVNKSILLDSKLVVLGESLCAVDTGNFKAKFWMLKEYGKVESWTKFSFNDQWGITKPLCIIGDEELVLLTEEDSLVVYNVKEGSSKIMVVDGDQIDFLDGCTFRDSLVSPDFGKQIEGNRLL